MNKSSRIFITLSFSKLKKSGLGPNRYVWGLDARVRCQSWCKGWGLGSKNFTYEKVFWFFYFNFDFRVDQKVTNWVKFWLNESVFSHFRFLHFEYFRRIFGAVLSLGQISTQNKFSKPNLNFFVSFINCWGKVAEMQIKSTGKCRFQ